VLSTTRVVQPCTSAQIPVQWYYGAATVCSVIHVVAALASVGEIGERAGKRAGMYARCLCVRTYHSLRLSVLFFVLVWLGQEAWFRKSREGLHEV
jgi:hypothetical protein